ncbi:related to 6-hydroxy-D-nicotine oxidase [Rhynchosporium graminicola]|uniref:Related to 6-hydroxy-D-nicotine oxidase n=1 Tax=Rhynchosporium graminicola TaxID=2792576 RepID=A0A1E1KF48_9HELO|nr:related to 6-hydroxy-D-nicotine oxidase [Rhynchosporium commune]
MWFNANLNLKCTDRSVEYDTGVGGLTLGGGYGYLTPAHGLAIDNLISVDYVLADGKIVTASDVENQDLFWAARGAGASFGIATSFVYRAHDQKGPVWAAMLRLDIHHLPAMVVYGNQFLEICEEKSMMFTGFVKIPGFGNGPSLMSILFYNGPEDAAKSFYADVLKLDSTVLKMGEVPFSAMNTYLNDSMAHDLRRSVKGSVYMPPMELSSIETIYRELNEFALEYQDASMSGVLIEYIPFKNVIKVPQTATAFANRGAYANVAFVMTWTKEELDDICRGKARLWASRLQEEFQKARSAVVDASGLDSVTQDGIGEYMNYDGLGSHGDKMFGINYPRLKELKLRYDPQNRFNKGPQLI